MCCASGRDSSLKQPSAYLLDLPRQNVRLLFVCPLTLTPANFSQNHANAGEQGPTDIVVAMVSFAEILRLAADELYHSRLTKPLSEMSESALRLDMALVEWRRNLPLSLDLDKSSLREPEWISKQKVVLKLRELPRCSLVFSGASMS